ncbi:hypothetical protein BGZ83_009110 [Gryganskiella cystojenkinii]|nr:hypothetical protein BGZ83_009110 [Gryganskiella cystojenkinii]
MLPELDRLIANHLDRLSLAYAARVCKLWHAIFNPTLWKKLSLKHLAEDDDEADEDSNFVSRRSIIRLHSSSLPSMPSSCSSTWSASVSSLTPPSSVHSLSKTIVPEEMGSPSSPSSSPFVTTAPGGGGSVGGSSATHIPGLTLLQHIFLHTSRNKVLKGLVRHGHLVQELRATGITDQEMSLVGALCPKLRVLELIGGRYTAENLSDLFRQRRNSIQCVWFRSCVQLKDIFQPVAHLSNLREFKLYGSFVGNTITSPLFFKKDLFPMLAACPQLRVMLIEQVYIVDQQVDQEKEDKEVSENNNDAYMRWHNNGTSEDNQLSSGAIATLDHVQDNNKNGLLQPSSSSSPFLYQPSQPHDALLAKSSAMLPPLPPSSTIPRTVSTTSILSAQLKSLTHDHLGSTTAVTQLKPRCRPLTSSLKSLTLDCGDIPDSVIRALLTRCPMLEHLSLDWSRELCDSTLKAIPSLCPKLSEVSFCRCIQLSSEGFCAFFRAMHNLTSVDLKGNIISDIILEELVRSCPFLRDLNLNSCQGLTDLGVQSLLLNCVQLSSLSLRFVSGLSSVLFDDNTTLATLARTSSKKSVLDRLSVFGSSTASALVMKREWACRDSLRTLHLPDLTTPNKAIIDTLRLQHQQSQLSLQQQPQEPWQLADGNQLIQARFRSLSRLERLTLGGPQIDIRVVMDGLLTPRQLESLRITRLKRTMTCAEAQWLVETATPGLLELAIPVFGNRAVIEWIEDQYPGLLTIEK